ncbi:MULTISPECIES: hypothetical protein [unclassified Viridibacillus]|nr:MULTISPECIES: hypothetical protein [unclassified Viridibacillus]
MDRLMATLEAELLAFEARVAHMQDKLNELKQVEPNIQQELIKYKKAV